MICPVDRTIMDREFARRVRNDIELGRPILGIKCFSGKPANIIRRYLIMASWRPCRRHILQMLVVMALCSLILVDAQGIYAPFSDASHLSCLRFALTCLQIPVTDMVDGRWGWHKKEEEVGYKEEEVGISVGVRPREFFDPAADSADASRRKNRRCRASSGCWICGPPSFCRNSRGGSSGGVSSSSGCDGEGG